jgi:hypothetical protein
MEKFFRSCLAVAWAFFGIRRRREADIDIETVSPLHIIVTGIVLAALFVVLLVFLVGKITG